MKDKLSSQEITDIVAQYKKWLLVDDHHLVKVFNFKDFKQAIDFVNKVAKIAEKQNHHPDMHINYNKVELTVFSHDVDGLSKRDSKLIEEIEKD